MSGHDRKRDPEAPRADDQPGNFVAELVEQELAQGALPRRLMTRFPPEPNGYLHIGHAKSIALNFGLATLSKDGVCNLRFDDTNPETESTEFVESIQNDVRWLGFDWGERLYYASDYFDQLYAWAEQLIAKGLAYVDVRSEEAIREARGDFHRPGVAGPERDRSPEENLALFRKMRDGGFEEGEAVLRAKIDLASKDVKLRDPLMYRIKKVPHHRTGTKWCIYPMYDWAHGQSDAIEGVTHSICTLEFVNHHALYDWFLAALEIPEPPRQIEFGKLNLSYTVLSKRRLQRLVNEGHVRGWDDPRLATLAGLRRRGYPAEAIVAFCERIGVSRNDGVVDIGLLEHEVREHLNAHAPRRMGVVRPLKVVLENYPEGQVEQVELANHPMDPSMGTRTVPFSRELWIERDDWMDEPPKQWFRLGPGREVRLRGAAIVRCTEVVRDADGVVQELRCHWDPESKGGNAADGRKVKGTIHWLSATHAAPCEMRLYERLFADENPNAAEPDFLAALNPESLEITQGFVEPSLKDAAAGARVQLERLGYFVLDTHDSRPEHLVLNRTIGLKDGWAKIAAKL
ncbi:MAG: glutamine--tRNA ligase/YqeY domain fusion protein [Myxococcales bacterium]|nr:glutamine--tRNA ligase/YqeY domain fusion protein [Myxococcales bacterium]